MSTDIQQEEMSANIKTGWMGEVVLSLNKLNNHIKVLNHGHGKGPVGETPGGFC